MRFVRQFRKQIALFLLFTSLYYTVAPVVLNASNGGPTMPEYTSFEDAGGNSGVDMVTGDYTYNLPLMNVPSPEGGYPINMFYHSGVPVGEMASWAGLGWNINPGAITRVVNGEPDDYNGERIDIISYDDLGSDRQYSLGANVGLSKATSVGVKVDWGTNKSLGWSVNAKAKFTDSDSKASLGGEVSYGNHSGLTLKASAFFGTEFPLTMSMGATLPHRTADGYSNGSMSFGAKYKVDKANGWSVGASVERNFDKSAKDGFKFSASVEKEYSSSTSSTGDQPMSDKKAQRKADMKAMFGEKQSLALTGEYQSQKVTLGAKVTFANKTDNSKLALGGKTAYSWKGGKGELAISGDLTYSVETNSLFGTKKTQVEETFNDVSVVNGQGKARGAISHLTMGPDEIFSKTVKEKTKYKTDLVKASLGLKFSSKGVAFTKSASSGTLNFTPDVATASDVSYYTEGVDVWLPLQPFGIPVDLSFSYHYQKRWLFRQKNKHIYGPLYFSEAYHPIYAWGLQNHDHEMDVHVNPADETNFNDPEDQEAAYNYTMPDYDVYQVTGQGISGTMSPRIFQNGTLVKGGGRLRDDLAAQQWEELEYVGHTGHLITKNNEQIYFRFDGSYTAWREDIFNNANLYDYTVPNDPVYGTVDPVINTSYTNPVGESFYNATTGRLGSNFHVEYFTNEYINTNFAGARAKGFMEYNSDFHTTRTGASMVAQEGIGAFTITRPDGMTYHYALPVYHWETMNFTEKTTDPLNHYLYTRDLNKYAYAWLLTAVTGPDFCDVNSNGYIDNGDKGYWVQFNYGLWANGYTWRDPLTGYNDESTPDFRSYSIGRKQVYYLNSIKTRTHTAYFIKDLRSDALSSDITINGVMREEHYAEGHVVSWVPEDCPGWSPLIAGAYAVNAMHEMDYVANDDVRLLRLKEIILVENQDADLMPNVGAALTGYVNGSYTITDETEYNQIGSPYFFTCAPPPLTNGWTSHYSNSVIDVNDLAVNNIELDAVAVVELYHDYSIMDETPNSMPDGSGGKLGKLSLNKVRHFGSGKSIIMPSYKFAYDNSKYYLEENRDNWGYHVDYGSMLKGLDKDGFLKPGAATWCLKEITLPEGGKIAIDYEADDYALEAITGTTEQTFKLSEIKRISYNQIQLTIQNGVNVSDFAGWFAVGNDLDLTVIANFSGTPFVGTTQDTPPLLITANDLINRTVTVQFDPLNAYGCPGLIIQCLNDLPVGTPSTSITASVVTAWGGVCTGGGVRVKNLIIHTNDGDQYKTTYSYTNPLTLKSSGVTAVSPRVRNKFVPLQYEIPGPGVMYGYVTQQSYGADGLSHGSEQYHFETLQPLITDAAAWPLGSHMRQEILQREESTTYDIPPSGGPDYNKVWMDVSVVHNQLSQLGRPLDVKVFNHHGIEVESKYFDYYEPAELKAGIIQETYNVVKVKRDFDDDINYNQHNWRLITSSRKIYPSVLKRVTTVQGASNHAVENINHDFKSGEITQMQASNTYGENIITRSVPAYVKTPYVSMGSKMDNVNNANMLEQNTGAYMYNSAAGGTITAPIYSTVNTTTNEWTVILFSPNVVPSMYKVGDKVTLTGNNKSLDVWVRSIVAGGVSFTTMLRPGVNHLDFTHATFYDGKIIKSEVQTWSNSWTRREYQALPVDDYTTVPQNKNVWRKYASYEWNSVPSATGLISSFFDFNWTSPASSNWHWQEHGSPYVYDEYSLPVADQNLQKFGEAFKTGYDQAYIIAEAVNANTSEIAFSGAEDVIPGTNFFGGEVRGAYRQQSIPAHVHTGNYSVRALPGEFGMVYRSPVGSGSVQAGKTYRANVWLKETSQTNASNGVLYYNISNASGTSIAYASVNAVFNTTQSAGLWRLLQIDIPIPAGAAKIEIGSWNPATTGDTETVYFDDFRFLPLDATMTCYVYNPKNGRVIAELDQDHFATQYNYDNGHRLSQVQREVSTGFRLVKQFSYNYGRTD